MKLTWHRDKETLEVNGETFVVTNNVRNELNGRRKLHDKKEVVRAIVDGVYGSPYMPRQFPLGTWKITEIEETTARDFAPIKIKTDARQAIETWALDKSGGYDHPTGQYVIDSGYYLHWSQYSKTTLGCGRVGTDTDTQIRRLASIVGAGLAVGEVFLEVV